MNEEFSLSPWMMAERAALVSAVAPAATAGIVVRGFAGPVRDEWLLRYRSMLEADTAIRRVPIGISPGRLTAGVDLAATLREGRIEVQPGILAESDGDVILLSMAERMSDFTASTIAAALDNQQIIVHRDGVSQTFDTSIGVIAFDEALVAEESMALALKDRLAMWLDLSEISVHQIEDESFDLRQIAMARAHWQTVTSNQKNQESLCVIAMSLGVDSMRALLMADRVSRIVAALDGRDEVNQSDLTEAVHLVLVPRATQFPHVEQEQDQEEIQEEADDPEAEPESPEPDAMDDADNDQDESRDDDDEQDGDDAAFEELMLQSIAVSLPADLMSRIKMTNRRERSAVTGRSGELARSRKRGRPIGNEPGMPESGKRLDLLASLRAAAPWQPLRRKEALQTRQALDTDQSLDNNIRSGEQKQPVIVKADDLHVKRFQQRAETTTIFVVDASGSAALNRLAEAKGAVESLLADCYSRRDQVALIAFKGSAAEVLLPPTRSLVRAKKAIVALPGGGGTPIATALDRARLLAEQVQRDGSSAAIVLLTDGKANICRDGSSGREAAMQEALDSAAEFAAVGFRGIIVDTSPRPGENAQKIANKLGGHYLPLPVIDGKALSGVIQDVLH